MTRLTEGFTNNKRTETFDRDGRNTFAVKFTVPHEGWLKGVGANIGGDDNEVDLRFALYSAGQDGERYWQSVGMMAQPGAHSHNQTIPNDEVIGIERDGSVIAAVKTDPTRAKVIGFGSDDGKHFTKNNSAGNMPATFLDYQEREGTPCIWLIWIRNHAPLPGSWRDVSPVGFTADPSPIFSGTMPHPQAEEGLDQTIRVHLQVWRNDLGPEDRMLVNLAFTPTDEEVEQGYFLRRFEELNLPLNVECTARFRHRDSWGTWSDRWSEERKFTRQNGPLVQSVAPNSKVDTKSGFNYTFDYWHTQNRAGTHYHIRVWNKHKRVIVFDSTITPQTIAGGTEDEKTRVNIPEWHGPLEDGRVYHWEVRAKSTQTGGEEVWSDWSGLKEFRLNSPPRKPTGLVPSDSDYNTSGILRGTIVDPDDEDRVQQIRIQIWDRTGQAWVAGYAPPGKLLNITSGTTFQHQASGLALNRNYRWNVQASDGSMWGEYSDWAYFTYLNVPTVQIMAPDIAPVRNMAHNPSAEYETDTYWTVSGSTSTKYINRLLDGNAADKKAAWQATGDGTAGLVMSGEKHVIDPQWPIVCFVEAKKENRDLSSSFTLRLECFDINNVSLGYAVPGAANPAAAKDLTIQWDRYGGTVWPATSTSTPRFPVGTHSIQIQILPVINSASVVRFDSVFLYQIPFLPASADWSKIKHWYGFFDGDTKGYFRTVPQYRWEGTPPDAESSGPNILTEPSGVYVAITWNSPSGRAKAGDRTIIQRWSGSEWRDYYDSKTFTGGSRLLIPMPVGVLKNQSHYRIKVQAQDVPASGQPVLTGSSPWSEFDVEYAGPPELPILDTESNHRAASMKLTHIQTSLDPESFDRYEYGVERSDGHIEIVDVQTNPGINTWVDHAPESSRATRYYVRQVELRGTEAVHGRWASVEASVDYWPFFFLKSVGNPNRLVRFEAQRGNAPSRQRERERDSYVVWGSRAPVHVTGEADYETGSLQVVLFDAPNYIEETAEARRLMLHELAGSGTCILLMQLPSERRYVEITGLQEGLTETLNTNLDLEWSEADYERDYYDREGEEEGYRF